MLGRSGWFWGKRLEGNREGEGRGRGEREREREREERES